MNLLRLCILVAAAIVGVSAHADTAEVELDYRLQPDRDLTVESVIEAITTLRVIEDRGMIARSGGRLSSTPATFNMINRQSFRYITGPKDADGRFQAQMLYLDKTTHVKGSDGVEQRVPEKVPLIGVRVAAMVEAGGRINEGAVEVTGIDASVAEPLRKMMASVLAQATAIEPLRLSADRSTPQEIAMQLPVAGMTTLDMKMRTSSRLIAVEQGIARIQQTHDMVFGTPPGAMKMTAEGSGAGEMAYEVATKTLLGSDTGTLMKFIFDTPEGVMEIQMSSRQSQKMRPSDAPAK